LFQTAVNEVKNPFELRMARDCQHPYRLVQVFQTGSDDRVPVEDPLFDGGEPDDGPDALPGEEG
jgi:hypothetical protein